MKSLIRHACAAFALIPMPMLTAAASAQTAVAEPPLHAALNAPERLTLSGSVRARGEAIDGQSRAGFGESDRLFSIRTTILAEYRGDGWRAGGELFDSRAYGARTGSAIGTGEVNTIEPVQAYIGVTIAEPFGKGSRAAAQLGRFTLNLGSRRLVAADEYRNTTNGSSGLRTDLHLANGTDATLIYTLPQLRLPDDAASIRDNDARLDRESFDLRLWGGIVSHRQLLGAAMGELSYFRLDERDSPGRPNRNRHLDSVSARIIREPAIGKIDYEIEAIRQTGTVRASIAAAAPTLQVGAWFAHADIGYSFAGALKARVSIEYDYASGDAPGGHYGRFDTLFGMRRADLAPAGIYAQIGRANISTPAVRIEIAPTKRLDAFVTYRPMWLAEKTDAFSTSGVRDARGLSGSFAGHQMEGRARWWWIPTLLRGEINAAWIAKGRFLKQAPNAPAAGDTHYGAVAVTAFF